MPQAVEKGESYCKDCHCSSCIGNVISGQFCTSAWNILLLKTKQALLNDVLYRNSGLPFRRFLILTHNVYRNSNYKLVRIQYLTIQCKGAKVQMIYKLVVK